MKPLPRTILLIDLILQSILWLPVILCGLVFLFLQDGIALFGTFICGSALWGVQIISALIYALGYRDFKCMYYLLLSLILFIGGIIALYISDTGDWAPLVNVAVVLVCMGLLMAGWYYWHTYQNLKKARVQASSNELDEVLDSDEILKNNK